MRRLPRRLAWAIGVVSLVLVAARPTAAVQVELWTITPTALTAHQDQANSTTFTVTNLSTALPPAATVIGCVRLNVPNSISLDAAAMVSPTDGTWTATMVGGGVDLRATTMGARLDFGEAMRFSITITPAKVGAFLFAARAFESITCNAPQFGGSNTITATMLPPILPTASPIPTAPPLPTPLPTAVPTLPPLPTPGPLPTALPLPTPRPTAAVSPSPTPQALPPDASDRPSPTPRNATVPGSSAAPAEGSAGLTLGPGGRQGAGDELLIDIGTGTGLDGIVWTVPAFALGSPGIALILWVAIQTASGVVWLPWVRRLRRTRRERGRSPA